MKFKVLLLLIWVILISPTHLFAINQSEFQSIYKQIENKEYSKVEEFLVENKSKLQKEPEYYVILLNYVISKGDQSGIVLAQGTPEESDFTITDSASGKVVGFMGSRGGYDEKLIVDGITQTQNALKFFKSRLDIYFGIISIAETVTRWDIVGDQIVSILKTSKEINNEWTWGPINSMEGNPKDFMIQNILPRAYSLFNANTPIADEAFKQVSNALIQYYPDLIYGYSNLGVYYSVKKDYDRAENYLRQALKIDPNDEVVLGNLAHLAELRDKK